MQTLNSTSVKKTEVINRDPFLVIKDVSKVYATPRGPYTVVEGINFTVHEGEFICLSGHSGCGKSTLLDIVAGFRKPSQGEVRLQTKRISKPGPERMVVSQNSALLPWLTVFENVYLGIDAVWPNKLKAEKVAIVNEDLALMGLSNAANKKPKELSESIKQRVSMARALVVRPSVLILDEPFGALDLIAREELQEELLKIWRDRSFTVLMSTHDIDEALFLADRLVIMTDGPAARIGEVMNVHLPHPRNRDRLMEDPEYYNLRNYALNLLYRRAHSE